MPCVEDAPSATCSAVNTTVTTETAVVVTGAGQTRLTVVTTSTPAVAVSAAGVRLDDTSHGGRLKRGRDEAQGTEELVHDGEQAAQPDTSDEHGRGHKQPRIL